MHAWIGDVRGDAVNRFERIQDQAGGGGARARTSLLTILDPTLVVRCG